jgi:anti-anti-sigma factor
LAADENSATVGGDSIPRSHGDQSAARDDRTDGSAHGPGSRSILPEQIIIAPEILGLESRVEFRQLASNLIERITTGTGALIIECGRLRSIDSAGLNALILVRRKAAQRRVQVVLRDLDADLLDLLKLTKLDDLFEMQDGLAR